MQNPSSPPDDDVPEWLGHLSQAERDSLTELLDAYLQGLERGEPLDLTKVQSEQPRLAEPLRRYLQQLDLLHGAAAEIRSEAFAVGGATGVDAEGEHHRLGDFTLVREIGRGGMGLVYEAIQESLGRRVALKLLPMAAMFSPKQVARFRNEAQAAAQLQHPHIVPVYAIGAEKGIHYFAMPLIEGKSLDEIIVEQSQRADQQSQATRWLMAQENTSGILAAKIRLGADAADALHAAHEVGIVHRDIKPSNLLLDLEGTIFVADFGLARDAKDQSLTRTGELIGTMRYMSPEQARGIPSLIDHRTDIYSLAVSLYEFLTGQPAIEGADGVNLLRAIEQPIVPLKKRLANAPADLGTVLQKAMEKDKEERYLTARAFADDLRCVVEGKPTLAKPPTLQQRIGSWGSRHRKLVASSLVFGSVGLFASLVLVAVFAWLLQDSRRNFLRAEQHFKEARDLVDVFGSKFTDQLNGIAGAEPVRQAMLRESLKYHLAFAKQASNDPLLKQDLATTLYRIGSLTRELDSPTEAIPYFREASLKFEELKKRKVARGNWFPIWARNQGSLGLALGEAGDLSNGIEVLDKLLVELRSEYPDSVVQGASLEFVQALNNQGLLYWRQGRAQASRELLLEALRSVPNQVASNEGDDLDWLLLHAAILDNVAATVEDSDPAQASLYLAESLELQRERNKKLVLTTDSASVARTMSRMGAADRKAKNLEAAARHYQEAIRIQRDLVAASPSLASLHRDLALSLNNRGLILGDLQLFEEARLHFEEAQQQLQGLLKEHPEDLASRSGLGVTFNNLAMLSERQKDDKQAAIWYYRALSEQRFAYEKSQGSSPFRDLLSTQYANFSRLQRRAHEWDEAVRLAVAWRALWPENPDKLLAVAKEIAEIAVESAQRAGGSAAVERYQDELIQTLNQAKSAGLRLTMDIIESTPFRQAISLPMRKQLVAP